MLVASLSACTSSSSAIYQSLQFAIRKDSAASSAPLNPAFRYLRATVDGRVVLLVLGYVESHPQGRIEVWYSAEREVLRLQNGRIIGAVGLPTEWRNVAVTGLPPWSALKGTQANWLRVRDVMPGYRYGVRDALLVRPTPPPARTALQSLDPHSLSWFEETIETESGGQPAAKEDQLPPARYAVSFRDDGEEIVYAEQCLGPKLCFSWQRWPALEPATKVSK